MRIHTLRTLRDFCQTLANLSAGDDCEITSCGEIPGFYQTLDSYDPQRQNTYVCVQYIPHS